VIFRKPAVSLTIANAERGAGARVFGWSHFRTSKVLCAPRAHRREHFGGVFVTLRARPKFVFAEGH
jgi:hypothetical protein